MDKYNHVVSFVLDDKIINIDFSDSTAFKPTTTILNYLRSLPGHKGVKEGCAEGDCGACTVVVAEPDGRGGLEYKSMDSCLVLLPMVHGKQLITIENLAVRNGRELSLHPVQQAMVETGGSQCGYCTPGIVMSLFALYKNHQNPDIETVTDALTGNLCRCTGYRPIIEAATKACNNNNTDHFSKDQDKIINLLQQIDHYNPLMLNAKDQTYLKPFNLEDALHLRNIHPDAMIINGSTDASLLQTKKRVHFSKILDISAVIELKLSVEDHSVLAIGAGVSLQEVLQFTRRGFPAMAAMLEVFGSLQIRNMATLGGNIGSASPIGDMLPVLIAAGSKIRLASMKTQRELSLEDLITGYRKTAIKPNELITLIIIPKTPPEEVIKSYKISKRKDLDISTVSACFKLGFKNEVISTAALVYGGMAEMPKRAKKAGNFLIGKKWERNLAEVAAQMVYDEFTPISDARAEAVSRRIMAKNLLIKFWLETGKQKQPAT
jgi:xanthine dehydrogenase small subunit